MKVQNLYTMAIINNDFQAYSNLLIATIEALDEEQLMALKKALLTTYHKGGNIYMFGNGGSGATASHISGDFMKGVSYGLEKRFRMICLNDNYAALGAISNDIGYEDVFVEQLKNHAKEGDLVIGISGSGNSENVVRAMEYAKSKKISSVAMCGYKGGKIKEIADVLVHVPVMDMEITEDLHMIIFHMVKQSIIKELHGNDGPSYGEIYKSRVE